MAKGIQDSKPACLNDVNRSIIFGFLVEQLLEFHLYMGVELELLLEGFGLELEVRVAQLDAVVNI